jgi:hypothetical protein
MNAILDTFMEKRKPDYRDFEVDRARFEEWRVPRFGTSNPTRMDNPVWEWLIWSRKTAYQAAHEFQGDQRFKGGPTWCFDRFGRTTTPLPDGRLLLIAGEHEDYYDPDFYIYNDVVVIHPDESVAIFGYPRDIFPPTDFHTATLVDEAIFIVGNLGYPEQRRAGHTPVFRLNRQTFAMEQIETSGDAPGWIHRHTATLTPDQQHIRLTGGKVHLGENRSLTENIDEWQLNLAEWRWERLTARNWPRWEVKRRDGGPLHLDQMEMSRFNQMLLDSNSEFVDAQMATLYRRLNDELIQELGGAPDYQLLKTLYRPDIPHQPLPQREEEHNIHRLEVQGTVVRYVQSMWHVQVTVEGDLPAATIAALQADLVNKVTRLENTACTVE